MANKLFQERFDGLTFIDYLELSEGIAPTQTKYGTDGSNGKFEHSRSGYTTLIHDGAEPVILMFDYTARPGWFEATFATLKPGGDPSKLDPDNYEAAGTNSKFSAAQAMRIFGKVVWVIGEFMKHTSATMIAFQPGYARIGKFYQVLLQNQNFTATLHAMGAEVAKDEMEKRGGSIFYIRKRQ